MDLKISNPFRLAILVTLGLSVGAIDALTTPRQYNATATLLVTDVSQNSNASIAQIAAQFGIQPPRSGGISTQLLADLIKSRSVLQQLSTIQSGNTTYNIIRIIKSPAEKGDSIVRFVNNLKEDIDVIVDRAGFIRLSVTLTDSLGALLVAKSLIEKTDEFAQEYKRTVAMRDLAFLDNRREYYEAELRAAERAMSTFEANNRSYATSPSLAAERSRLQRNLQSKSEIFQRVMQSLEVARFDQSRSVPMITVIEMPDGFVKPLSRGLLSKALLGIFSGIFIHFGLVIMKQYWRTEKTSL